MDLEPDSQASASPLAAPSQAIESDGHWCWRGAAGTARFAFYGKPTRSDAPDLEATLAAAGLELATLRQVHSARVVEAVAGPCGEADALVARRCGLALRVVTADCVPILLDSASGAIAAVHAGWRGLAAGIVEAAVERLGPQRPIRALIGPAIGACCYQVGRDVADEVARRAGSAAVIVEQGDGRRPHLDLALTARLVLERAGVDEVVTVDACTRCQEARWSSYRRDGKGAGRNLALVWRE